MLIDRTHRGWAVVTLLLLILATVLYVVYAQAWPDGPSGRTWPGMLFGVAGTLAMIWAGLLAARKQVIAARLGSAAWWLKSHIWLGLLSLPLIAFHAAFRWGGLLEQLLWVVLLVVIVSGIIGLLLQNVLPRSLKLQVADEIIPDQLAHVCHGLQADCDAAALEACGADALGQALEHNPIKLPAPAKDPNGWLAGYYIETVRPYLGSERLASSPLAGPQRAELIFERARATLPDRLHAALERLESRCTRRRELATQMRLYGWLHGWLRIHVPLSIALLVLGVVHVVTALYY